MQSDYVSELQHFLRSVCQVAELCQPPDPDLVPSVQEPTSTRDIVSIQPWMLEYVGTDHPFLTSAQTDPSPITRSLHTLLIHGEALFLKHRGELMGYWDTFVASGTGEIPCESAVWAGLVHCHACILRELYDIPAFLLRSLFRKKRGFWEVLATVSIPKLIADYSGEPFISRNLLLDTMLSASLAQEESSDFFTRQGEFVSMAIRTRPVQPMPRRMHSEVESLLNQDEIKALYLSICKTPSNQLTDTMYYSVISDFLDRLYLTNIHYKLFDVYGITLTGRQVIIDDTLPTDEEHFETLVKGYRIVIILHEFAHFLIRAPTRTVKDFMKTATPKKDWTSDYNPQGKTPIRILIEEHFPISKHGEAGYLLETELFGSELTHINVAASVELLRMAECPKPLKTFKHDFCTLNQLSAGESSRMGLDRRGKVRKDIMLFGRCGMPQPYGN